MSIKIIAEKVGASPATVSRVLNNPDYRCSKPGLRDKIWKAAIELDYTPNMAARNLKLGVNFEEHKIHYINVLMTRADAKQSDPFFSEILHVLETEIHKKGCILSNLWYRSLFSNDARCETENIDRVIRSMYEETGGKTDGLVIVGRSSKLALEGFVKVFKNVVIINRNSSEYNVDEVLCDGRKIARTAVDYLYSLGHRKIGYVGECKGEVRYSGYVEALGSHGLEPMPDYVIPTRRTESDGYDSMLKFLRSDDCPTGIYCANDITAIGMLKCLQKHKKHYPRPSIIASDDIEEAQFSKPMLTTVRVPADDMGRFAVKILLDRINGEHTSVVRMELESKLMIRESCQNVSESLWSDYCI
ncbi:MAG: LacI family DNA-binding transcriptional regulator [Lachnospiraceae bacterium]|nr:LacI family DNA-binding transcriptional regulator [Lachnospiraceae bacterium]